MEIASRQSRQQLSLTGRCLQDGALGAPSESAHGTSISRTDVPSVGDVSSVTAATTRADSMNVCGLSIDT